MLHGCTSPLIFEAASCETSFHHQSEAQPGRLTAATSPDTPSAAPASQSNLHRLTCEIASKRHGTAPSRGSGLVSVCAIWARNAHSGFLRTPIAAPCLRGHVFVSRFLMVPRSRRSARCFLPLSIAMVRPSIHPSSRSRFKKAASLWLSTKGVLWPKNPPGLSGRSASSLTFSRATRRDEIPHVSRNFHSEAAEPTPLSRRAR
jgi:hypothetical protein